MGAGNYPIRFAWFANPLGTPDGFGQRKRDNPTLSGYLWGRLEGITAGEETTNEVVSQVNRATITLRNRVTLAPRQILTDGNTGVAWTVVSWWVDGNETIAEVTS